MTTRLVAGLLAGCFLVTPVSAREAVIRLSVVPSLAPPGHPPAAEPLAQAFARLHRLQESHPDRLAVLGPGLSWPDTFVARGITARLPGAEYRTENHSGPRSPPLLGVNLPGLPESDTGWTMAWVEGVRVVLVGVANPSTWTARLDPAGPRLDRPASLEQALVRILPRIRAAEPQVWILVADAPAGDVRQWLKRFPEFHAGVALGGTRVVRESRVDRAVLVAPGGKADRMAEIRVVFDTVRGTVTQSGGHLAWLDEPGEQEAPELVPGADDPLPTLEGSPASLLAKVLQADIALAPARATTLSAFDPVWSARLTRTGLRELLTWIDGKHDTLASLDLAGVTIEPGPYGLADAVLRDPSGKSLHATRRYQVVLPVSILVHAEGTPPSSTWVDPRNRWADTGRTVRALLHEAGSR